MSTALATLTSNFATRFGLESNQDELMVTLKATAFKGQVSDAQMTALMLVAQQYNLNPWTREIYAFPDKNNGIVPVVGVDGWSRIMNDHPQFDGMEFKQDDDSCTCIIYRKDRAHAISATEYMSECKRTTGPWSSHPKRMLRHKAMIQAARLAFGFGGIYDQDEAERIVELDAIPGKQTGAQAAQAAREITEDTQERRDLIARLEKAASFGLSAYSEDFAAIGKEGRALVGADEHARIKALADRPAIIDQETGEVMQ